jgi:hypothetical protein
VCAKSDRRKEKIKTNIFISAHRIRLKEEITDERNNDRKN